ncbi:hypothetical protein IB269_16465 [Delftia sp. DLF01]|uniref:hypothetical protein n=1 Tax=Delftia sp. DLF01 TaxID=2769279 RepID=UPI00178001A2|nr:hypothetical protein [Delftia sp. DLF01]MBD9582987.1 hypothetical protein [Delftia sp. DLF01]
MPALTSRPFGRRPAAAPAQDREERLAQRAARALASARATVGMACSSTVTMGSATGQAQPKAEILTCEAYRRAVASLPCISCGIHGFSQHAHLNLGKGFALKTDDRTGFPLCCTRPDIEGCHVAYDNYRLVEGGREGHRAYGLEWGRITRHTIQQRGLWPARLPLWKEDQ